jgi:hypothetical protein
VRRGRARSSMPTTGRGPRTGPRARRARGRRPGWSRRPVESAPKRKRRRPCRSARFRLREARGVRRLLSRPPRRARTPRRGGRVRSPRRASRGAPARRHDRRRAAPRRLACRRDAASTASAFVAPGTAIRRAGKPNATSAWSIACASACPASTTRPRLAHATVRAPKQRLAPPRRTRADDDRYVIGVRARWRRSPRRHRRPRAGCRRVRSFARG